MTQSTQTFRTVMRGYDTEQVDERIAELTRASEEAQHHAHELHTQVEKLRAANGAASGEPLPPPGEEDFAAFGVHIGQILKAAHSAAGDVATDAQANAEAKLAAADATADEVRTAAERDASSRIEEARLTAEQLVEKARQQADTLRAETERAHQEQLALDADATASLEQELNKRREETEAECQARLASADTQRREARDYAAKLRNEIDQADKESARQAGALIADSERRAKELVAQAQAHADGVRTESDAALTAATAQRDGVMSQLTNIWQSLASVTGVERPAEKAEAPVAPKAKPDAKPEPKPEAKVETKPEATAEAGPAEEAAEPAESAAATDETGEGSGDQPMPAAS
jgi:cell division septum initiation protein DivIVA